MARWIKDFLVLSAVLSAFLLAGTARAFSLSPARVLLTINPGEKSTVSLKVVNTEKQAVGLRPVVLGVAQSAKDGRLIARGLSVAESWTELPAAVIRLEPGADARLDFIITVPAAATPGSYYLGLGALSESAPAGTSLSAQVLAMVTIQVAGAVSEHLNISQFAGAPKINLNKKFNLSAILNNAGNIEVKTNATATFKNVLPGRAVTYQLGAAEIIFAGGSRQFDWPVDADLKWPGLYRLELAVTYGRTAQTATAVDYVWYLPLYFWLIILLILTAAVAVKIIKRRPR